MVYRSHRDLLVWIRSVNLTRTINDVVKNFPNEERYALSDQMRRSVVSIPSNIAEGNGRGTEAEFDRSLRISIGSACELDTQVEIAYINGYISYDIRNQLVFEIEEIMKMIFGLRKTLLKTKD